MNVLLAPVAVFGLAVLGAARQVQHNSSNSLPSNFSSEQSSAALESSDYRSLASSISQPA
ncbi:MAG: hypothetical protein ACKO3R_02940 [bacterium]